MSNYRKTMADALREMYPLDEETQLDEATMSSSQIARLKKAYEPMRDKKISPSNADKLSAMMDKVGKDKETLIQLFKADIPFVSQSAVTKLITKHNMKGAEINKLREEVYQVYVKSPTAKSGWIAQGQPHKTEASAKKDAKNAGGVIKIVKEEVDLDEANLAKMSDDVLKSRLSQMEKSLKTRGDSPAIQFEIKRLTKEMKKRGIQEEVGFDKLPDMSDALRQVRMEEVVLDEAPRRPKAPKIKFDDIMNRGKKPKTYRVDIDGSRATVTAASEKMAIQKAMTQMKVNKNIKPLPKATVKVVEEVGLDEGKMSQLHQYIKDKKSAEEIAKLMKVDVKTIKALMSSHHPEEVEEGAADDARRAMSRDKDFSRKDSADDDTDATDDDVRGASKNIMMQMRKAQSLNGRFDVEFADGKKVKIPAKMAMAVQSKYNKMRRPAEKEKFQAKIAKSYRDMLSALKEAVSPAQHAAIAISKKERGENPKKESVLDRIDRKIKEKNDG